MATEYPDPPGFTQSTKQQYPDPPGFQAAASTQQYPDPPDFPSINPAAMTLSPTAQAGNVQPITPTGAGGIPGIAMSLEKGAIGGAADIIAGVPKMAGYGVDLVSGMGSAGMGAGLATGGTAHIAPVATALQPINQPLQQTAQGIKQSADMLMPTAHTLPNRLAHGVGSAAPVVVASSVNPALGAGLAATQGMSGVSQEIMQSGRQLNPFDQATAELGGAAIGAAGAMVPMQFGRVASNIAGRMGAGAVGRGLAGAGAMIPEGYVQGVGQTIASNAIAQQTFDPNRPLMQGVNQAGIENAIINPVLGGVSAYKHAAGEPAPLPRPLTAQDAQTRGVPPIQGRQPEPPQPAPQTQAEPPRPPVLQPVEQSQPWRPSEPPAFDDRGTTGTTGVRPPAQGERAAGPFPQSRAPVPEVKPQEATSESLRSPDESGNVAQRDPERSQVPEVGTGVGQVVSEKGVEAGDQSRDVAQGLSSDRSSAVVNPNLPPWVNDEMVATGKNPNRLLNEIDAARPKTADQLANDPVTRFLERADPAMAERAKRGDLSKEEYLAAKARMKGQDNEPAPPAIPVQDSEPNNAPADTQAPGQAAEAGEIPQEKVVWTYRKEKGSPKNAPTYEVVSKDGKHTLRTGIPNGRTAIKIAREENAKSGSVKPKKPPAKNVEDFAPPQAGVAGSSFRVGDRVQVGEYPENTGVVTGEETSGFTGEKRISVKLDSGGNAVQDAADLTPLKQSGGTTPPAAPPAETKAPVEEAKPQFSRGDKVKYLGKTDAEVMIPDLGDLNPGYMRVKMGDKLLDRPIEDFEKAKAVNESVEPKPAEEVPPPSVKRNDGGKQQAVEFLRSLSDQEFDKYKRETIADRSKADYQLAKLIETEGIRRDILSKIPSGEISDRDREWMYTLSDQEPAFAKYLSETRQADDIARREKMVPVDSGIPGVTLWAIPGQEKEVSSVAAKMGKIKPGKVADYSEAKTRKTPEPFKLRAPFKKEDTASRIADLTEHTGEAGGRYGNNLLQVKKKGKAIIATDGRRLVRIIGGDYGKEGNYFSNKGKLVENTAEDVNVAPVDDILKTLPDGKSDATIHPLRTIQHLRKARLMMNEEAKGVLAVLNSDGTLGFATHGADGMSTVNVQDGAKELGGVNPEYLADILHSAHRQTGSLKVDFWWEKPNRAISLHASGNGHKFDAILMPVSIEGNRASVIKSKVTGEPVPRESVIENINTATHPGEMEITPRGSGFEFSSTARYRDGKSTAVVTEKNGEWTAKFDFHPTDTGWTREIAQVMWESGVEKLNAKTPDGEYTIDVNSGKLIEKPSAKGTSSTADIVADTGTIAPRTTERRSAQIANLPQELRPVAQPELFQFAKDLMEGRAPETRKSLKDKYGYFASVEGMPSLAKIVLNASALGPDPGHAAATLSHEIGHLVDYLPEATLKRGNVLGRVASLVHYLKNTLPGVETTNKEFRKELEDLSFWWRPIDPATADPKYLQYRKSGKELYADAISALLVSPGDLKDRAPKFFKSFIDLLDNKPHVRDRYFELQHMLNGDSAELARTRQDNILSMFGSAQEQWDAAYARQQEKKQTLVNAMFQTLVDKSAPLLRVEKQAKKGLLPWDEQRAAKHAMEEFNMRSAAYATFAEDVKRNVEKPLNDAGVDMDTAGSIMMLQRVAEGDRGGSALKAQERLMELTETKTPQEAMAKAKEWLSQSIDEKEMPVTVEVELESLLDQAMSGKLNPLGYDPESAKQQLKGIENQIGPEKFKAATSALKNLRDLHGKLTDRAVDEGVYNREIHETVIKPNSDFYAPFAVAKYLGTQVKAGVFKQVGTYNDIANPMHAMMMKSLSLIRLTELNRAKRISRQSLSEYEPGSFQDLGKVTQFNRPRVPEGKALHIELEDGKPHAYATDPYISQMFKTHDIGTLARFARVANTATYRVFHPLWIGLNPAFQVFNIPRDLLRSYINAVSLHANEGTARQIVSAFTDIPKLAGGYLKPQNVRAAWRRARNQFDPLIRQMNEERALGPSHSRATDTEVMEANQFERFLQQSGIWEAPESKSRILRGIGHLFEPIQTFGNFIETLPKVAMYDMATKAGMEGQERAYIVRNLSGTPNSMRRGLATELSNVVLPYSNVVLQGYRADAEVALNPKTAAGRAMRAAMTSYLPKLAMAGVAAGLFGKAYQELMDEVPEYDKAKYIVVPLGWSTDDKGDKKATYLRLPHNDTDRLPSAVLWKLLTGEKIQGVSESLGIATGELPSWNPWAQIASKWMTFAGGQNPRDDFRGREIVGKDEYNVGGLPAIKQMLYWTAGQFGAPGDIVRATATIGKDENGLPTSTSEKIIKMVPGLNRMVKVSARGEIEKQQKQIAEEDEMNSEVRLALPSVAKTAASTMYRLNRLGDENLSPADQAKRDKFRAWSMDYRDAVKAMKARQDEATSGKISEAEKERRWKAISKRLEESTRAAVGDGR